MANLELNMYVQNSTSGYDKLLTAYDNTTSGLTATNTQSAIDEIVAETAPKSHASTATTYGVGSTTNYGHCKTINNLTASSYVGGESLSAYQGKLLNDSLTQNEIIKKALRARSVVGIASYPNEVGVYRIAGGVTGLPIDATGYGELIIYGGGYFIHVYVGTNNTVYLGNTPDSITPPTNWIKLH